MVNKIIDKNSVSHDINDARIASLDDVKPSISGTSLVIPESSEPKPEPILIYHNVEYYHLQEIDIESLTVTENETKLYDILTGEDITDKHDDRYNKLQVMRSFGPMGIKTVIMNYFAGREIIVGFRNSDGEYTQSGFEHEFTVVDHSTSSTDEIWLPDCTACLMRSTDGKILNVYYTLIGEGTTASKIDSIQQGNAKMPIVDDRLPEPTAQDADKVLKVGATGEYELGEAGGGDLPEYGYDDIDKILEVGISGTPTLQWGAKPSDFTYFGGDSFYRGAISGWIGALQQVVGVDRDISQPVDVLAKFYDVLDGKKVKTQFVAISYSRSYRGYWISIITAYNLGSMKHFTVEVREDDQEQLAQSVEYLWENPSSGTKLYKHTIALLDDSGVITLVNDDPEQITDIDVSSGTAAIHGKNATNYLLACRSILVEKAGYMNSIAIRVFSNYDDVYVTGILTETNPVEYPMLYLYHNNTSNIRVDGVGEI